MQATGAHGSERPDVIVCGSGISGFAGAITALENGARVTIVEKAPAIGGSTVLSSGVLWTVADYDEMRRHIPQGNPILQWLVHDALDEAAAWLFAAGVRAGPHQPFLTIGRGWQLEPAQAIEALAARFRALGGEIRTSCAMEALLTQDGRVSGLRCVTPRGTVEHSADAVILATGGFQANAELVSRYVVRDAASLALRGNPWSTGDGLIAATAIGAALTAGLDKFYGHALCAAEIRGSRIDFQGRSQYYGTHSVALNLHGRRFCDESENATEEVLNYRLAQQPEARGWYVIDEQLLSMRPVPGLDVITSAIVERARAAGARVVTGASLDEFCRAMAEQGLSRLAVHEELSRFNAAMEGGFADDLSPPRQAHRRPLSAPFYAVPVQAAITFTMGGLAVDERGRVLRRAASSAIGRNVPPERASNGPGDAAFEQDGYRECPIPGLYAAGCDVGNISHRGYMGGLSTGLVMGRMAGRDAAGYALRKAGRQSQIGPSFGIRTG